MDPTNFVFWLQGRFELDSSKELGTTRAFTLEETRVIREHLDLVFAHVAGKLPTNGAAMPFIRPIIPAAGTPWANGPRAHESGHYDPPSILGTTYC